MSRRRESFSVNSSEKSVIVDDMDKSKGFSTNDDISYLYQRTKQNKINNFDDEFDFESFYNDKEEDSSYTSKDDSRKLLINRPITSFDELDDGTVIDVRRERKYNYGIATLYLIVFLLVMSLFINQLLQFRVTNNISDQLLNRADLSSLDDAMNKKIEELHLENKMLWLKVNDFQAERLDTYKTEIEKINEKIDLIYEEYKKNHVIVHDLLADNCLLYGKIEENKEKAVDHNEKEINYMNYKFGTKLIKEWTSSTYTELPFNKMDSSDLLSPVYNWDSTMNWPCELKSEELYCKIGIHLSEPVELRKLSYNSICGEGNIDKIELFQLDEATQSLEIIKTMTLADELGCNENSRSIVLFHNASNTELVSNLVFKVYPKEINTSYLLINSFTVT